MNTLLFILFSLSIVSSYSKELTLKSLEIKQQHKLDCFEYFTPSSEYLKHILKNEKKVNYQLNIWSHRSRDLNNKANDLEDALAEFLGNSHIYTEEFIDEGLNGAMLLGFKYNIKGVFKEGSSRLSSISSEVAAFKIDRMFGFDLVPITIERTNNGRAGSLQLFVKDAQMEVVLEGRTIPQSEMAKMNVLDYLIDNQDRHGGNYLITKYNKIVAIDHGLALRKKAKIEPKFNEGVVDFFNSQEGKKLLSTIKSTPDDFIRNTLKHIMSAEIIDGIVYRKNALIEFVK